MGSKVPEENLKLIRDKLETISERGLAFQNAYKKNDAEAMVCLYIAEQAAHVDSLTKSELYDDIGLRLYFTEKSFEIQKTLEDLLNDPVGKEIRARYGSRIFQGS